MKKIYKYELDYRNGNRVKIFLPVGCEVLSCNFQHDKLVIWAFIETWQTVEKEFEFVVLRTGEVMPDVSIKKFIGTATDKEPDYPFVIHVFLTD